MRAVQSLLCFGTTAQAVNLFVSSYSGIVSTLALNKPANDYTLESVASANGCGESPSWLSLDKQNRRLYCLNEGFTTGTGSVSFFNIANDGKLAAQQRINTIVGPVSSIFVGPQSSSQFVVAHYGGSAVTTWDVAANGGLASTQNFTYTMPRPGPDPLGRQDAPHNHQALADPTGQFIVVPDLGADLLRIYHVNQDDISEQTPVKVTSASGPRHGVFWKPSTSSGSGKTYYFLGAEFSNKVYTYSVTYNANKTLSFTLLSSISSYGPNTPTPSGASLAEIQVSPDNAYVYVSNRGDASFTLPNPNPLNSTKIKSDSLGVFTPNAKTGALAFVQLAPSGGSGPRHFELNKAGDLVAVGNQGSGSVVVLSRSTATGKLGSSVAFLQGLGQVNMVAWDE